MKPETLMSKVKAFGQHVLDMEARLIEGTVTLHTVTEAWAVFADLLEEEDTDLFTIRRARAIAEGNPDSYDMKYQLCLGVRNISWSTFWDGYPPTVFIFATRDVVLIPSVFFRKHSGSFR